MITAKCGFNLLGTPDNVRDVVLLDNALDLTGPAVVEMRVAFIEHKDPGCMDKRSSKSDKHFFSTRKIAHRPVSQGENSHGVQEILNSRFHFRVGEVAETQR